MAKALLFLILVGGAAAADDRTAARLRPWIAAEPEVREPTLGEGFEASVDVAAGGVFSGYAKSPVVVETGAIGHYVASSGREAWSLEAIEKLDVALDDTTPQFGLLGIGVRRLGRQRHGSGILSLDFERIAAGLAWMSRGSNLVTGVGAELAGGTLSFCGSGLGIHVDGYFFARPDAPGVDGLVTVSFGYVYSPTPRRARAIEVAPASVVAAPPPPPAPLPCTDATAVRAALVAQRQRSAAACNAARDDASRVDECNRESDQVLALRAQLAACEAHDAR